jgi:NADPH:quinone reductase-like Zn-dependent oxidoreductase
MGVEVTTTASGSAADRLRGLGAAEIIDYHDPDWPGQARGGFDGALTAAIGTAEAALPLVRDGGRLCSLTSDAPAGDRGIASTDLYVRPDATQLAQLARQVSEGALQMTPEVHPLREGPAAFTRVAAGRASGRKLVLIP